MNSGAFGCGPESLLLVSILITSVLTLSVSARSQSTHLHSALTHLAPALGCLGVEHFRDAASVQHGGARIGSGFHGGALMMLRAAEIVESELVRGKNTRPNALCLTAISAFFITYRVVDAAAKEMIQWII
jgi:hypothetical protein